MMSAKKRIAVPAYISTAKMLLYLDAIPQQSLIFSGTVVYAEYFTLYPGILSTPAILKNTLALNFLRVRHEKQC